MNASDKLKELERQMAEQKRLINQCNHVWGETMYDPKTVREPSGIKLVGRGSDYWYEHTDYVDKVVPRWSRTCNVCGVVEYTEKEVVEIKYKPKFNEK